MHAGNQPSLQTSNPSSARALRVINILRQPHLCNQLDNTTGLLDLSLGLLAEPSRSHNDRDLWDSALSENFGVSEREEVENWCGIGLLAGDVGIAGFLRDKRPELQ